MIFETLYESANRGELMLVDSGFCHWHLRRDGQLTIREIIATRRGAGSVMLNRLKQTPKAKSIFAKCPFDLPSTQWYIHKGFTWLRMEETNTGRRLVHFELKIDHHQQRNNLPGLELIYCANGNPRLTEIAIDAGFIPGAQLPGTIYYQPYFVDQNWKTPRRADYMRMLETYRPRMATVLDWDENTTFAEVMSWAEEASQFVKVLVVIPKIWGTIDQIPEQVNGVPVRLGYSVPTAYGRTEVPLREFDSRPVHLLGGSPIAQMELYRKLNVKSVDGNYIQKLAVENCQYFVQEGNAGGRNRYFPSLNEMGGGWNGMDAPYEAFRRGCNNLMQAWKRTIQQPRSPMDQYMEKLL